MKTKFYFLILAGIFAASTLTVAKADEAHQSSDSLIAGRLPLDTQLQPTVAANRFMAADAGGSGKIMMYFATLAGLMVGGYFLLKRGLPMQATRGVESSLRLRETKMLGNRQFLVVAEYEGNRILIGVGPGRIEYLCPLDRVEEPVANPVSQPILSESFLSDSILSQPLLSQPVSAPVATAAVAKPRKTASRARKTAGAAAGGPK